MIWKLQYDPAAEKDLSKLDKGVQRSDKKFLTEVCDLADPAARRQTLSNKLAGQHTYRIGQLRVVVTSCAVWLRYWCSRWNGATRRIECLGFHPVLIQDGSGLPTPGLAAR